MTKLPNAPLIEVIFEIRWNVNAAEEFNDQQLILGALNSFFKEKFQHREVLQSQLGGNAIIIGSAMYRFRNEDMYPMVQIGPGVISFNTDGELYEWKEFYTFIKENLSGAYRYLDIVNRVAVSLSYIDFFKLNEKNSLDFVNENFNINIINKINTLNDSSAINFSITKPIDIGNIFYTIGSGMISGEKGVLMQTVIGNENIKCDTTEILTWYNTAHNISSSLFKEVTAGKLYNTFL